MLPDKVQRCASHNAHRPAQADAPKFLHASHIKISSHILQAGQLELFFVPYGVKDKPHCEHCAKHLRSAALYHAGDRGAAYLDVLSPPYGRWAAPAPP